MADTGQRKLGCRPSLKAKTTLTIAALTTWIATQLSAQTFNILHTFTNSPDGAFPQRAGLLVNDTTIYGTTYQGGSSSNGSIFKLSTDGTDYTILKSFSALSNTTNSDGALPSAGLLLSGDRLYGTAYQGGASGRGTLFSLDTNGNDFIVLKTFSIRSEGQNPHAPLVLDGSTLYGTTEKGGAGGKGIVFKVRIDGNDFAVLKSFSYSSDGGTPRGGLVLSGTTLFGTTWEGGTNSDGNIYRLNTDGTGFTVLKHFLRTASGANPWGELVLRGSTLFGTAAAGGSSDAGVVFKVETNGTAFSVLKAFNGDDGAFPWAGLTLRGSTLYGTTLNGPTGGGTLFQLNTDGTGFSLLAIFPSYVYAPEGQTPWGGLALGGSRLYGTTCYGGTSRSGVLFSFALPSPLQIQVGEPRFGVQSNAFGFTVKGPVGQAIVIEAAMNPASSQWAPLQTNTLSTSPLEFKDGTWISHTQQFYRVRAQ